jgi:hypothetical protein
MSRVYIGERSLKEYLVVPMVRNAPVGVRREIELSTVMWIEIEKALDRILGEAT